ncbi:MAG: DUF86 domain-containing protein [Pirellulales bacterium]
MSKHDPRVTLRQIADYARYAQELCSGTTLSEIVADRRSAFAFERVMEVLGEATKRLPAEFRDRYPAVPWKLVVGMRDRVSHGYDAVDYQTLWDTVQQDLPTLLTTVEQMLAELETPSSDS